MISLDLFPLLKIKGQDLDLGLLFLLKGVEKSLFIYLFS